MKIAAEKQTKKELCKAITVSTGIQCKRTGVENDFCRMHSPKKKVAKLSPKKVKEQLKNTALVTNYLQEKHTTKQKNQFIRIITVTE